MPNIQELKKELESRIHCLPAEELNHLLRYARFLSLHHEHAGKKGKQRTSSFLKSYIGGVSNGNLAKEIDKDVYG